MDPKSISEVQVLGDVGIEGISSFGNGHFSFVGVLLSREDLGSDVFEGTGEGFFVRVHAGDFFGGETLLFDGGEDLEFLGAEEGGFGF